MVDAISQSPTSVIVVIITFFSCWSVIGLAGFHTFLAASNQTTNEDVSIYTLTQNYVCSLKTGTLFPASIKNFNTLLFLWLGILYFFIPFQIKIFLVYFL